MNKSNIALMIYGAPGSDKNALTEEKYRELAIHFVQNDFEVASVLYHDSIADELSGRLLKYATLLVWVNPIEQGTNRNRLDNLLRKIADTGVLVSTHPDVILKMGTKEILFTTRSEEFGSDTRLFKSFEDFRENFLQDISAGSIRVLKQFRGNGGNGVYKIDLSNISKDQVRITHAIKGAEEIMVSVNEFYDLFLPYFSDGAILIDQSWNENITNGMIRCYVVGTKVAGFGYQEVNALYPGKQPGKRFYFSAECGLFRDLKEIMESKWIARISELTSVSNERMPVLWDADFFINKVNNEHAAEKYTLCEINVSSVSPFPESCIPFIVQEVKKRIAK